MKIFDKIVTSEKVYYRHSQHTTHFYHSQLKKNYHKIQNVNKKLRFQFINASNLLFMDYRIQVSIIISFK
jgi:Holliday junction resolvase RusA-like endonuclease